MAVVTTADGRRISYAEQGAGPPVLFIAGLGSTKGSWAQAIERLSPHYHCLAIDNRDAGENDPEPAGYSIADMADDAAAFLGALGIGRGACHRQLDGRVHCPTPGAASSGTRRPAGAGRHGSRHPR